MQPHAAPDRSTVERDPSLLVERTPWALLLVGISLLGGLVVSTVQGALSSNDHASAFYRSVRDRELRVFERAGLDPVVVGRGRAAYLSTCIACHGPNGEALPNLGKDLVHSEFIGQQTNSQLQMFLKLGRPTWDPANTTKIDMPGKGGNPMLKDSDLADIVQYLRFMQEAAQP